MTSFFCSSTLWHSEGQALVKFGLGPGVGEVVPLTKPGAKDVQAFIAEQQVLAQESYQFSAPVEPDDMRSLGIEKNSRGHCFKVFTVAVLRLVEDAFEDWPLRDGIRNFLWLVEKVDSDGLAPVARVEAYLARKKFGDNDRAAHELRSMSKTIEGALTYDHLIGASLVCLEHVARRFQPVVGAHSENAQQPNYVGSSYYYYLEEGEEAIAPDLCENVTKNMKDEAKTAAIVEKLRELKGKPPRPTGSKLKP